MADSRVPTAPSARPVTAALFGATGLLMLALGPAKGLAAILGALVLGLGLVHPLTGLAVNIFANTSLQVLGGGGYTGIPVSIAKLFGVVSMASILLHVFFAGWRFTASPIYRTVLIYLIPVVIWDFFTNHPEIAFMEGTTRLMLMVLLVTLIATIAGQSQRALDATVLILMAAIALCGFIALAEHYLPSLSIESNDPRLAEGAIGAVLDRESGEGVVLKRVTGGVGDSNWLAYTTVTTIPLVVYGWHRWPGFWSRSFVLFLTGMQGIALIYSLTRTGFLGLGFASIYLIARGVVPLRPFLGVCAVAFAGGLLALPEGFADRMFSSRYLKEGSTPLRAFLVTKGVEIWQESPIFGHGFKGFGPPFYEAMLTRAPDDYRLEAWADDTRINIEEGRELATNIGAHNIELELLVEYGLIGLILYFSIFIATWRELTKVEQRGPPHLRVLAICLKAGILAFVVCGTFGHAKYLKIIWIIFGLVMALRRVSETGDSATRTLLDTRFRR